jgi:hypothetical protein
MEFSEVVVYNWRYTMLIINIRNESSVDQAIMFNRGGIRSMRRMNLNELKENKLKSDSTVEHSIDHSVNIFRSRTRFDSPSPLSINALPRDPDEIKALNSIARNKLLTLMSNGTVHYDPERRVLILAKYSRGEN